MKRITAVLLALVLIFALAVPVAAEVSATAPKLLKVEVKTNGTGIAQSNKKNVIIGDDGQVILTASEDGFVQWTISGNYKIVSGSLTSKTLVIIPVSDIDVVANFEDGENVDVYPTDGSSGNNDSGTSPNTSDRTFVIYGVLLFAAAFAMGIAVKKIKA